MWMRPNVVEKTLLIWLSKLNTSTRIHYDLTHANHSKKNSYEIVQINFLFTRLPSSFHTAKVYSVWSEFYLTKKNWHCSYVDCLRASNFHWVSLRLFKILHSMASHLPSMSGEGGKWKLAHDFSHQWFHTHQLTTHPPFVEFVVVAQRTAQNSTTIDCMRVDWRSMNFTQSNEHKIIISLTSNAWFFWA